jgi:hypothetical protein
VCVSVSTHTCNRNAFELAFVCVNCVAGKHVSNDVHMFLLLRGVCYDVTGLGKGGGFGAAVD